MTQSNNRLPTLFDTGGEVSSLLRDFDWSASALGHPDVWPLEIRVLVRQMLASKFPMHVIWGTELHVLYNDAYIPVLDNKHPYALGSRLQDVFPEIWNEVKPLAAKTMAGIPSYFENQHYSLRRGEQIESAWFTFSWTPVRDESNDVIGILCILNETTRQVIAEESFRLLNKRLEDEVAVKTMERDQLWGNSQDLLLVLSFDGTIHDVNPAWATLLGWARNELIGKSILDFIHPDDIAYTFAKLKEATDRTLPFAENRYVHKDGTYRWFRWTAAPDKRFIYANGRHVTQEREQAVALEKSADALRQSQKMEAVGQLTGGLAHDFNNMLAGIQGNLEMLKFRVDQGQMQDVARYIDSGLRVVTRAAALTHRLLAFSRRQTLDPKPTDANGLIVSMEDLLRRTLGPDIHLETMYGSGLWQALCDLSQLENAVLNLAINSRDAMPAGGHLTIETSNIALDDGYAAVVPDVEPGTYVRISVSDNGAGMTPEVLERAIDPFFTTKPTGQGTGLGLSMIYGFASQSDGHLRLYSEPGKGTTVHIYLPRHTGLAQTSTSGEAPGNVAGAGKSRTVLLVEDEKPIRELAAELLADLGYTVIQAADGKEGLEQLRKLGVIDLLVTDVGLPNGMNGRQLADAGREIIAGLKILFITGFAENAALGNGILEPGMQVMTKPFSMIAFANKVRSMAEGNP